MLKKRVIVTCIYFMFAFILFGAKNVDASDVYIKEAPVATEIDYGEPLFESILKGGSANVDGVFKWVNNELVLEAGEHEAEVIFEPYEPFFPTVSFFVRIKVNQRRVYLKFEREIYKQYDESRDIKLPNYIVGGIRKGDGVYVDGELKGVLESGLVSASTRVFLSDIELVGDKKENYYLDLDGFSATVYPRFIEKFVGDKNRVQLDKNVYVPINTAIFVNEVLDEKIEKDGYKILNSYDVYLASDGNRVDMSNPVKVKVKLDESNLKYKKLKVYNYYNNSFEEIVDYKYEDGYLTYSASSLGQLVFAQKKVNLWWVYLLCSLLVAFLIAFVTIYALKNRKKINKYKSLKRRKDHGDY